MINKIPYVVKVNTPFAVIGQHFDRNTWWEVSLDGHYAHLKPLNKSAPVPACLARTHMAELAQTGTVTAYRLNPGKDFVESVTLHTTTLDAPVEGRNEPPGG